MFKIRVNHHYLAEFMQVQKMEIHLMEMCSRSFQPLECWKIVFFQRKDVQKKRYNLWKIG
jgi:hypothetical protein